MRKGEIIRGYEILKDSAPVGGRGEISFAKKGGKEYFIKVFLSPKYPVDGAPGSPKTKAEKRKRCDLFEQQQKQLNDKIATKCALGGNLVYAIDFFRHNTSYYKINEKVDVSSLKAKDVAKLSKDKILIILKTLTHSLKILHDLGIVHGDLKPDNILIKRTETGGYTTKLIDFDDSYFNGNPPDFSEIVGTPEYYSPELLEYIRDTGKYSKSDLTVKSDIFTLGLIFTEYLCGERPKVNDKYSSVAHSVEDGNVVEIKGLPTSLSSLLNSMMHKDQAKRPNIGEVFSTLKSSDIKVTKIGTSVTPPKPIETPTHSIGTIIFSKNLNPDGKKVETKTTPPPIVEAGRPTIKIGKGLKPS